MFERVRCPSHEPEQMGSSLMALEPPARRTITPAGVLLPVCLPDKGIEASLAEMITMTSENYPKKPGSNFFVDSAA